jgi:hypothetical protein
MTVSAAPDAASERRKGWLFIGIAAMELILSVAALIVYFTGWMGEGNPAPAVAAVLFAGGAFVIARLGMTALARSTETQQ